MTQPDRPVWIDDDPLMEAIAAAVWEHCDTSGDRSVVTDDTRNISAVAAHVARTHAPAGPAPATDKTTPPRRAGLRDEIVKALGRIKTVPPIAHRREQADHVLAVLHREWTWLRAEAEEAATDRAALRERIAEVLWPLTDWDGDQLNAEAAADAVLAVLPAPDQQAAVLLAAADALYAKGRPTCEPDGDCCWYDAVAELRRLAGEAQQDEPTAADVQHMLTRMRATTAQRSLDELLRLIAVWAASSEGRDVLVEDLVAAGYRLPHACGNCEGIDPATCLSNPAREARQDPTQDGLTPVGGVKGNPFDYHPEDEDAVAQPGQPEMASPTAVLLATRCDTCQHTLNWHRNDVGCTVVLCVCSCFQPPAEEAGR